MFRLRTVAVVVLLTASSLLTLKLMGFSQWIQAILVIAVELSLGVVLHEMAEGATRRARDRPREARPRRRPAAHPGAPRRRPIQDDPVPETYPPRCRLLLPIRDDRPALLDYAIRECRHHRAELDVLFLRVLAIIPMGSVEGPRESEDREAVAAIGLARRRAEDAGVPFRSDYVVTSDVPATILGEATAREADLVLMPLPRRGRGPVGVIARLFGRDDVRTVLESLPADVGLLVHG